MKNIIVFIKQVPDTSNIEIDPKTNTLIRRGIRSITNVFDLNAIEEGLRVREKYGGIVYAVSMGPVQAKSSLREALAMGVDEAVLLSSRAFAGSDTWATSYVLAQSVKRIGDCDLIICGKQATDGDTAQVGPGIAAHLGWNQATYVKKIREVNENSIVLERMTEEGFDLIEVGLPLVLTVVKEINVPRYPSFKGKIISKRSDITILNETDINCREDFIGLDGSPTRVRKTFPPPVRKSGEPMKATDKNIDMVANKLCNFMAEK